MLYFLDFVKLNILPVRRKDLLHTVKHILNLFLLCFASFPVQIVECIGWVTWTGVFRLVFPKFRNSFKNEISFHVILQILAHTVEIFKFNLDFDLYDSKIVRPCCDVSKDIVLGKFERVFQLLKEFWEFFHGVRDACLCFLKSKL